MVHGVRGSLWQLDQEAESSTRSVLASNFQSPAPVPYFQHPGSASQRLHTPQTVPPTRNKHSEHELVGTLQIQTITST